MKLLVVIVSYRVTDLTIDCLHSLVPEIRSIPDARVAICENGTGGDAEQRLRDAIDHNGWADRVDLTAVHPNRGFTGGNNVVIRQAMASAAPPDYLLLLNADTIVTPGALQALLRFMDEHPSAGIAGSLLQEPDGRVQGSPYRFYSIASEFDRGLRFGVVSKLLARWNTVMPKPAGEANVQWVCGASMIIRRSVVEAIGPLDEDFYTYFDDIDYCLNAARAGWSTWWVPQSRIVHLEGASTGITHRVVKRRPPYWFQARRRFFLKNFGPLYAAMADAAFIIGFALWRLRRVLQRKPDGDPPHMLWDSIAQSVFLKGFKLQAVENPAMPPKSASAPPAAAATVAPAPAASGDAPAGAPVSAHAVSPHAVNPHAAARIDSSVLNR